MATTAEIKEIFNSFIPAIQIGRVVLENGGGVYQNKIDPHIDWEGEGTFGERLGQKTETDTRTLKRSGPDGMKVTCNLVIKDVVTPGVVGTFFRNRDLTKLLTVRFVYATTPEAMQEIINNNPTLDDFPDRPDLIKLTDESLEDVIPSDVFEPKPVYRQTVVFRNRSVETDLDGNEIHSFTFDRVITGLDNNAQFLAVFACCRIDLEKLFTDAPGTLEVNPDVLVGIPPDLLASKLSYNIILQGGNVFSSMPIFVDEETGKVWSGQVHQMPNGRWMTGAAHSQNSKYVTRRMIPNTRVQDFRISSYLDKRILEIHTTEKDIMGSFIRNARNDLLDINRPRVYFSDISFARDESGNARFFFSMDYNRILEDNTTFGALLMKNNLLSAEDVARYCNITSFKVFRTRIKGSPEAGSKPVEMITNINSAISVPFNPIDPKDIRRFSNNEVDELIVSTSEKGGVIRRATHSKITHTTPSTILPALGPRFSEFDTGATPVIPQSFGIQQVLPSPETTKLIGSIEEIRSLSLGGNSGIRHFSGIDKTMGDITDGYYQYRIEVEIYDGTDSFLLERLTNLLFAQRTMRQHLYLITRPGAPVDLGDYSGGRGGNENNYFEKIGDAVNVYLQNLFIFTKEGTVEGFDPTKPSDATTLQTQLIGWCSRETPNGTAKIITLMDQLARKLADVGKLTPFLQFFEKEGTADVRKISFGTPISNINTDASAFQQPRSLMNSSTQKVAFQIKNKFNNYFNSNIDISTSFDFMNLSEDMEGFGFKKSSGAQFLKRIKAETQKCFAKETDNIEWEVDGQTGNPGDSILFTNFSYCSPYRVIQPLGLPNIQLAGSSPSPPISNESLLVYNFMQQGAVPPSLVANSSLQQPTNQTYQFSLDGVSVGNSPALSSVIDSLTFKMADMGVVSAGTFLTLQEYFGIEDPVDKDNTTCYPSPDTNLSINPAPLFNRLMEQLNPESYTKGAAFASSGGAQQREAGQRQAEANRKSMETARNIPQLFNPDMRGGPVSVFMQNMNNLQVTPPTPRSPTPRSLSWSQSWITTMPNHIKSLVKQNSATSDVMPISSIRLIGNAATSIAAATELSLKFTKINVIEVFTGYKKDPDSDWVEIKNPQWKTLDGVFYNNNLGNTILCRLKPYQNIPFGIVRNPATEPPTIDEYFFLTPSGGTTLPTTIIPQAAQTISAPFPINRPRNVSGITANSFDSVPTNLAEMFSLGNMPVNLGGI